MWAKNGNGTAEDYGRSVATDIYGNVYVAGYFRSTTLTFDMITLTNSGGTDAFIVKYDALGHVLWAQNIGGIDDDYTQSITTDTHGNVYVTGYFWSENLTIGSVSLNNLEDSDAFIAKYDSAGNVLWAKQSNGPGWVESHGVAVDPLGNVLITGVFNGATIDFDGITLNNVGYEDAFVAKYDSNGTILWALNADSQGGDAGNAIATDSLGNIYVAGNFNDAEINFENITLVNANSSTNDIFIAKYNPAGHVLWAKACNGTEWEDVYAIAVDASGHVYLTGEFSSASLVCGTSVFLTNTASDGTSDVFIVKFDSSGHELWARNPQGAIDETGQGISVDTSGSVYLTGYFSSPQLSFGANTITNTSQLFSDIFVVKYDSSGNILWAHDVGDSLNEEAYGIAVNSIGTIYLTGHFSSPTFTLGSQALTVSASNDIDMFIAAMNVSVVTETTKAKMSLTDITLYPNPSHGKIDIQTEQTIENIKVYNSFGQLVHSCTPYSNKTLDLSHLPKGFYIVQLKSNQLTIEKKIVKE